MKNVLNLQHRQQLNLWWRVGLCVSFNSHQPLFKGGFFMLVGNLPFIFLRQITKNKLKIKGKNNDWI